MYGYVGEFGEGVGGEGVGLVSFGLISVRLLICGCGFICTAQYQPPHGASKHEVLLDIGRRERPVERMVVVVRRYNIIVCSLYTSR